ncbi:porin [Candidatus Poribacteria bacterium]|nr:porin [Candidatus Poribacteria bacterium]
MKKKLLMAAVGAALVAGPMLAAQAAPTLYGSFHMSLDSLDNGDSTPIAGVGNKRGFLSSNSTRFGVKGDEDLGGGLKTIYQIESGALAADTGSGGMGGTLRNTYIGFAGSMGTVKFGRNDTPFKDLGRKLDNFNEQVGDARNIIGSGGANAWANWDARVSNMVRYESPNFSGAQVNVLYGTAEGGTPSGAGTAATSINPDPTAGTVGDVVSMNLLYSSGPMFVGLAYEKHGTTTNKQETGMRLAGSYDIDALTIGLFYESLSDLEGTASSDGKTMGLMAAYKMGNNKIKFHTYKADELKNAPNTGGALMAIGVDHSFSKTASMYVNYATADNDTNASFVNVASNNGGHGNGVPLGAADKDPKGYSVGMIVKF